MVVPQCIPNAPKNKLTLIFNNKEIEFGTKIHPFETVSASYLAYSANPNVLHTLTIFDPDQPFLYLPFGGQLLQGLIVNIPGMDVQHGDRLGVYVPHIPHPGSSYHRCVYLIFKQLEKIKITVDLRISLSTNLTQFNVYEFAKKFKLGDPIAGNFFISKLGTGEPRRVETPQITGH
ncbi:protein D2-like [Bicyclus anynana]|uniref:Protein D2-like n=1 Tax=Bicyclus anynana TaxID=110368 RepID=A0ABM3LXY2_BICAN|nr:protein D2-like [Bicyclus anynana]